MPATTCGGTRSDGAPRQSWGRRSNGGLFRWNELLIPICWREIPSKAPMGRRILFGCWAHPTTCRKNWRSEEHTSELQSLMRISYAVFCLKKKKKHNQIMHEINTITHNKKQ